MDALTPAEVTALMLKTGEKKVSQAYYITFFKAWMAGWMVCFGAMVFQVCVGQTDTLRMTYPGLINLVGAFFFPVGLIMLVLTGQELVTANFMILVMTTIKRRTKLWELPVNWLIVFFGNLAGSLCLVAFMAHYSGIYNANLITYSQSVAVTKTSLGWGPTVLKGIGCNFLVCMAVWLAAGSRDMVSKVIVLHFPIFVFVFLGFEHVVVNMFYIPIGLINGASVSVSTYIAQSMIPSFIGNVIGGCLLGVPMMLFYEPPQLPFFHKNGNNSNVIVGRDVDTGAGQLGDNLPEQHSGHSSSTAHVAMNGKKEHH